MAELLKFRAKHDFIDIGPVHHNEITFFKEWDQKEIKEAIEELEEIIYQLKTYVEDVTTNGG